MPMRKFLVLTLALVLAIAALAPASAPAKPGIGAGVAVSGSAEEGDIVRPYGGWASGESVFCPTTGLGSGDFSGYATHIGKGTTHSVFHVTGFIPPATLLGEGTFTNEAADGDQLKGTFTLTSLIEVNEAGENTGHTATIVATITGGTGRFEGASGMVTSSQVGHLLFRDMTVCPPLGEAHDFNQETVTGWISY